jgi:TrmH family RNA methyltransferase
VVKPKHQTSPLRIILVRPRNPLNIGAAARAMANFGFDDLMVVKPYAPVWRETVSAVGAEKLVLDARALPTLEAALADRQVVLGTTTVRDRNIDRPILKLKDLPAWLKKKGLSRARTALLFGSEKTGLPNKYLMRCNALVTIPTSPQTPSMNLGQAVAVCCYELARSDRRLGPALSRGAFLPLEGSTFDQLVRQAEETFKAVHYLDFMTRDRVREKIRRTFLKWRVEEQDLQVLFGFLRHVRGPKPKPQ